MRRVAASALILAACTHTSATAVNGPDGQPGWWLVRCKRTISDCEEKAGEVCPWGYIAGSQHEQHGMYLNINRGFGYANAGSTFNGSMLVRCRVPGEKWETLGTPPAPVEAPQSPAPPGPRTTPTTDDGPGY